MTCSSSKTDLHLSEPAINSVIAASTVEASVAEVGGAQHPVPPSPQRRQCLAPTVTPSSVNGRVERERTETRKEKSARMEREDSEDDFIWMGVSGRRKHMIHVLATD
jgi:hypothetical protein